VENPLQKIEEMKCRAIRTPQGDIRLDTISLTRKEAVEKIIEWVGGICTWKDLLKSNWRCVPIEIKEIRK